MTIKESERPLSSPRSSAPSNRIDTGSDLLILLLVYYFYHALKVYELHLMYLRL